MADQLDHKHILKCTGFNKHLQVCITCLTKMQAKTHQMAEIEDNMKHASVKNL
jgi:hypothetical protein